MTTITFDTLAYVKELKSAGFTEEQAEVHAKTLSTIFKTNLDDLATRRDLKELELANKHDIKELELRIAAELAPLKWGMAITVGGMVALILKSFFPH